ncbi:MAG: S41 family peptidase [Haliscomenobacter sp.]|nr:S41 family peptidase [Haliscomenobacter sp.]
MPLKAPQNKSRGFVWLPLLLSGFLALGIFIGLQLSQPAANATMGPNGQMPVSEHNKLEELIRYIEAKYVDEVDRKKLVDEAITSILRQLDPHSSYIPSDDLAQVTEQLEGQFEGIGIEFMMLEDTVVVVSVFPGGPAERAGIGPGDKILAIGDSTISGKLLSSSDVVRFLRGKEGTKVRAAVVRFPSKTPRWVELTREKIPIESIDAAYLIRNQVAYIRINRFSATTDKEFLSALEKLGSQNKPLDLILDLRHNPGGYLQQASNILSQIFEDRGRLLVYTEGRTIRRSEYLTTGRAFFQIGKVAVLIDEGSASASEILAGAVQDHDRGILIGRRSFGKGLVQEQYLLSDGAALRLTVARYFTPSGRSIQKPYQDVNGYQDDLENRIQSGELISQNRISLSDSTRFYTTNGRIVYGRGGIIPDLFIPLDSLALNPQYQELKALIPSFAVQAIQGKRASFPKNSEDFKKKFEVGELMLQDFFRYAQENIEGGLSKNGGPFEDDLRLLIKANIAKDLFGVTEYFAIMNTEDPAIAMALKKLSSPGPLTELSQKSRKK